MTADEFRRAVAFELRAGLSGSRHEEFRYGTAVLTPELPLRHDSNHLLAHRTPPDVAVDDLVAEAERILGGAGIDHRVVIVPGDAGAALEESFRERGWSVAEHVYMAHRRERPHGADPGIVVEVAEADLRAMRHDYILAEPWGSPELANQLVAAKGRIPVDSRFFAVLVEGEPVSITDLYADAEIAQIEDLVTLPAHRGRGYATALVVRALGEARAAGAGLVFLVADEHDWPKELYARLGFEPIGRIFKFIRHRPEP
jgi:GNAT superfamily N-acetyltransferase